ncbi:MAG: carboxypeptidase-like regulatory domain-containing protein, partial [Vicinamibacterales bacterium]
MVALLLLTLMQAPVTTPAQPPPLKPTAPAPAAQAPRPRPSGNATTTVLLFITDGSGRAIENVTVQLTGPVDREVTSPAGGPTRVDGLRAGVYRVRFSHEKFITFEKEITWRAGTSAPELSVTLNAAPTPLSPPPPAPAPAAVAPPSASPSASAKLPPAGAPKTVGIPEFL